MSTAQAERAEAAKLRQDDVLATLLTQHARIRGLFAAVRSSRKVLAELEKLDVGSAEFDALPAEFEQSVSDHEEDEEFPAVRRECSAEKRESMGKQLLTAEDTAPPVPTAAGSPAAQRAVDPFASLVDRARDAFARTSSSGS